MAQTNKKYVNIASGWVKNGAKGEYISASVNNKLKLTIELEDGTKVPVTHFAAFFTEEKQKESSPDLRFTMTVGE